MKSLTEQQGETERVFLVVVELKKDGGVGVEESMEELAELATTAGATIAGEGTQKLDRPRGATFIGKGKAGEFAESAKQERVDTVIFDDELSPAQTRTSNGSSIVKF